MTGLIVWGVFCLGIGLAVASAPTEVEKRDPLISGLAIGCLLWSIGIALWWLAGAVLTAWGV